MYLFFTIFGIIFISLFGTIANYIYDIFPINKITTFFVPIRRSTWNEISLTFLPTIVWMLISIPIMINNPNFLLGIILNLFMELSIIYTVKYGFNLISKEKSNHVNLFAIYLSTFIGQAVMYIMLISAGAFNINIWITIIAILILTATYPLLTLYPPKTEFFSGPRE